MTKSFRLIICGCGCDLGGRSNIWYSDWGNYRFLILVNHLSRAKCEISIHRDKKMVARLQTIKFNEIEKPFGDVVVYRFAGQINYINSQAHIENLSNLNGVHTVILNFRNLFYIDLDGMNALEEIINTNKARGKSYHYQCRAAHYSSSG